MFCKKKSYFCHLSFSILALLLCCLAYKLSENLSHYSFYTGWSMLLMMFALAAYNLRKKLTTLPVGKVSLWMRVHVYLGVLMAPAFLFHTSFVWPNGQLEQLLTLIFLLVFLTGVLGLLISKLFPKLLSRQNEEFIYERIPAMRTQLQKDLEEEIIQSLERSQSRTLVDFYRQNVHPYMSVNQILLSFYHSKLTVSSLRKKMAAFERYLNKEELECLSTMRNYINKKAELDYSYNLQFCLKYWLFIHVPFTWSLLVLSLYHVYIVYLFTGAST